LASVTFAMSWRYGRRRRTQSDEDPFADSFFADDYYDWFSSTFDFHMRFRRIDELIESMFHAMRAEQSSAPQSEGSSMPRALYYGYQLSIGPDGKPHLREFGNVRPNRSGSFETGSREPFIDTLVDENENALKIVAEMPGLRKEDVKLHLTEDSLTIHGSNGGRNYDTVVPLKAPVITESARANYNNGILEVVLKLKDNPQKKGGVSIRID
jgi:HSP20 family protein